VNCIYRVMKHKEPLLQNFLNLPITVETRYNEPIRRRPRYNDDLLYPSHDVIHLEKSLDITTP